MRRTVKLTDIHHVVLVFQNGSLVIVHVEIVGSGEDGDQTWKARALALLVHTVAEMIEENCS